MKLINSLSCITVMVFMIVAVSCKTQQTVEVPGIPEQEAKPYTVRYAPADASVSPIDPPAFVWLPEKNISQYELQYSRSDQFGEGTTTVNCPRTIHVPTSTLGSGQWYWRFAITDSTGKKLYSQVRSFTIANDAQAVPFPDVKKVIANLVGVRPRDFVQQKDVERYRQLGQGPLKDYIDELKASSDALINEQLHPEPPFLSKDPEQNRIDFVRIMRSTRGFNRGMSTCATAYLLTGEEKYGKEARRRLMHLTTWDPEGSTNLFHNDEPGHEIVRVMANTYDWIYPLLSEEDKQKVKDILAVRIAQIYKILIDKPFEVRPYESHAMDYYIGDLLEACICMAGEMPVEEWFEYVLQQLWSPFFPPYGGDDGGWCEGPSYWQWSTATFLRNFSLVKQNCGIDLTKKPWLQNTAYYKLYANPPYSKMSPYGDGQERGAAATGIMYKLGMTYDNPYALWWEAQLGGKPQGIERFIYYTEKDVNGKPPTDIPQARCFYNVGLACMHSDLANGQNNVMFMMRSDPFGSISHTAANQNAFVVFAYGEPMAIASGYYPYYSSPHHVKWTRESKAYNTIVVDGKGQKMRSWDAKGKITEFQTSDYAHYACGDATTAYEGRLKGFLRHSLYLRPTGQGEEPVIIIYDDVKSATASTYDWYLHSLEQMDVDEANEVVTIKKGAARMKVQFLTPAGLKFSQTDTFTVKPEGERMPNQWHLNATTANASENATFVTVMMPYREGQESVIPEVRLINDKPGWIVVELTGKQTRQVAAFRTDENAGRLKSGKFKTKAAVAASAYDLQGNLKASFELQ